MKESFGFIKHLCVCVPVYVCVCVRAHVWTQVLWCVWRSEDILRKLVPGSERVNSGCQVRHPAPLPSEPFCLLASELLFFQVRCEGVGVIIIYIYNVCVHTYTHIHTCVSFYFWPIPFLRWLPSPPLPIHLEVTPFLSCKPLPLSPLRCSLLLHPLL